MNDDHLIQDSHLDHDDDRQLKKYLFLMFWVLSSFLSVHFFGLGDDPLINILILFLPLLMSLVCTYFLTYLIEFLSSITTSMVYGFNISNHSYENGPYQGDMDNAKKLVREGKLNEAIAQYREVIQKSPQQIEPRFNLARTYEKAGYPGLALSEYRKIIDFKERLGTDHPLVFESEKAVKDLKNMMLEQK